MMFPVPQEVVGVAIENFEVLRPVVCTVAINVVDQFAASKWAPEHHGCY